MLYKLVEYITRHFGWEDYSDGTYTLEIGRLGFYSGYNDIDEKWFLSIWWNPNRMLRVWEAK